MVHCSRYLLLPCLLALLLATQYSSFNNGVLADEDPQGEVNLNKNTAYNNALKCLQNSSLNVCPSGTPLNESGKLMVNSSNDKQYCNEGCSQQTFVALSCINNVLQDFRFNNDASTSDVRKAIQTGCENGNFTVQATSDANINRAFGGSIWMLLTMSVATCLLVIPKL